MASETRRVTVAAGRTIHRGPSPAPFRAGAAVELPADHAAALMKDGHVEEPAATPKAAAAEAEKAAPATPTA